MTTRTHDTEIVADPTVPQVRITREFDATTAQLFRAHSDPDLVAQWLGPRHYEIRIDHYDCRTGGSYRYVHASDDQEHGFFGCFHLVVPGELIIQTFTWDGLPEEVALERMRFEDLGDGRARLVSTSLVDSFESRDGMLASGMVDGLRECYERLEEVLAR